MTQDLSWYESPSERDLDLAEAETGVTPPEIDRPIIVVSAGRSGSTVFHDILTHHPDACWLPLGCSKRPSGLRKFRLLFHMVDFPVVGSLLRRRFQPVEGYGFWDHHCPGFSRSCRDLRAEDVTPASRQSVRGALDDLLTARRPRLVLKMTGWPRAGFLREVFPDGRFIHLVRDGRSVAASLLQVPWWRGWEGPENWRFGPLSSSERKTWERHDRSFVALAGIQWTRIMEAMGRSQSLLEAEDAWHTVRYEDLCRGPDTVFREVLNFSGLPVTANFLRFVADYGLESRNSKWRSHLSSAQQATLEEVVSPKLKEFGYK